MSYMVVMIVNNNEQCSDILDAWENIGVLGVTILASTGLGHVRREGLLDDLPLIPSVSDLFERSQIDHRTLFAVVENEALVDRMAEEAQKITGDLEEPHTGFMFVVPVLRTFGMGKHRTNRSSE
jgi:hypothetical protein